MEIKEVKGYENEYLVSDTGRIIRRWKSGNKELKPIENKDGYYVVCLCKNNKKRLVRVHRIVAEAFLPNHEEWESIINHKDEDKRNNDVRNLEWCTVKYNTNYNGMTFRRAKSKRKPIRAIKGGIKMSFPSVSIAASSLGLKRASISNCLCGNRKTLHGYVFEYEQHNKNK